MQKLVYAPEVLVTQLYKCKIGQSEPILPFKIKRDMEEGSSLIWKLLTHQETYVWYSLYAEATIGLKDFGTDLPNWGIDPTS